MTKKRKPPGENSPKRHRPQQPYLVTVEIGGDYEHVNFIVDSEEEFEKRRDELLEQALEFHRKCLFIREVTSSSFLQKLASDLACEYKARFLKSLAVRLAVALLERYSDRLKEALGGSSWAEVVAERPFVEASTPDGKRFVIKPPRNYNKKLVKICSDIIEPILAPPAPEDARNFWQIFAEWTWINQMALGMDELESSIGTSALEKLPTEELFDRILTVLFETRDLDEEVGRLHSWFIEDLSAMLASSPLPEEPISLRQLEILIGLVDNPAEQGALIFAFTSHASQIEAVLRKPKSLQKFSSRRFEELVAFALEKSGYEVRLTPRTRDGGFDIEAVRHGPIRQHVLVECKRYSSRKVGRPTLDALLGVLHREKAPQGLLVTTSSFSRDAQKLLEQESRLQGMDSKDLLKLFRRVVSKNKSRRTNPSG